MKKSRLEQLIAQFSKKELKNLQKFVASPYFNSQRGLSELLSYYVNNQAPVLNKVAAYQVIFPNKKFDETDFRLHKSYLFRLIEKYIAYEEIKNKEFLLKQKIMEGFKRRNLSEFALRSIRKAEESKEKQLLRNADYYEHTFHINLTQFAYDAILKPTEKFNSDTFSNLDITYFIRKLNFACFLLSHQNTYKLAYDLSFIDIILKEINSKKLLVVPAIATYYYCYLTLAKPSEVQHFEDFKQLLLKNSALFSKSETRNFYLLAINFCIQKINKGSDGFFHQALDLYKGGLSNQALLENGILSRFTYHNIVKAGIQTANFEWVAHFIDDYKKALEKRYQESAYSFSKAHLAYHKKKYAEVLDLLQTSNYRDLLLNLGAKTLLLKVYYELAEFNLLHSHLDAMKNFIRRKRVIGYHKTNYLNIIRLTQKLLGLNVYDKSAVLALQEKIENEPVLTEKKWLLEQLKN